MKWILEVSNLNKILFLKMLRVIIKFIMKCFLLLQFLRTIRQIKNMNNNFYDLYYILFKNRDDKKSVNNKYGDIGKDHKNYEIFITPNLYFGIKINKEIVN